MEFGNLTIDGLSDTGALTTAISEAVLRKIWILAPQTISNEGPPSGLQLAVANGHLKTPSATVENQVAVVDILFRERFIFLTNITSPLVGLLFYKKISTILDQILGVLNFLFFSM